jgi:hypothetical protein
VVTSTWQMIVADSCDSVAISFEKLTSALYQPLSLRFACTVRKAGGMGVLRARSFGDSRFGAFTEELVVERYAGMPAGRWSPACLVRPRLSPVDYTH